MIIVESRLFKFAWLLLITVTLSAVASLTTFAQESEPVVVDEVIAQVNNDVITLSMLKHDMNEALQVAKQNGMSEQQASDEVSKHKADAIARLVNEQLLLQKGKDMDLSTDVESEVNKRLLELASQQGCKTLECLDNAMKASGIDPAEFRQSARREIMKSAVLQREVDSKIYYGLSPDELKKYYSAHQDKFRRPESVTLSDIFLNLAGRNETELLAKANQLVAQARGGADFSALAVANSEMEEDGKRVAPQNKGKVGAFQLPDLRPDFAAAIKNVAAGGVTDPIKTDEGYHILRVDERTAGSDTPEYNEEHVRQAMTAERADKARTSYLQKLQSDAYIKIADGYKASVEPLLSLNPTTASATKGSAEVPSGSSLKEDKKSSHKNKRRLGPLRLPLQ